MSVKTYQRRSLQPGCSGTILICVLACLAIVTATVTATVRSALRSHLEVRQIRNLRQTELLLEAGILRAHQQVTLNADYEGELWQLAAGTVPGEDSATIEITRQDVAGSRQISVVARHGEKSKLPIQRSFQFTFDPPSSSNKE